VVHDDDTYIGCQYCTWNCPYGVPVFHEERKIVTNPENLSDNMKEMDEHILKPAHKELPLVFMTVLTQISEDIRTLDNKEN